MILSVHQPQYLPWLGYFHKIDQSDLFVFLDNVQYKKREFQNRNKIKTADGWMWLTVPVLTKGHFQQCINQTLIDNSHPWQTKHFKSIQKCYSKAPFFFDYYDAFEKVYAQKWERLDLLNMHIVKFLMDFLEIKTPCFLESELDVNARGTERIIEICKRLKATVYLSGAGGKAYMNEERFEEEGIKLRYQNFTHPVYSQLYGDFQPYMSVIDLLFNHGNESMEIIRNS
ncbi:TPA: hypothetical protein EYP66_19765 [Candidatus Poribacteria bacterium]|nr:hypothetical protein [Candidatus Poribacteria bacterium]